jgi:hypothetical protein
MWPTESFFGLLTMVAACVLGKSLSSVGLTQVVFGQDAAFLRCAAGLHAFLPYMSALIAVACTVATCRAVAVIR